jgi:hypothetical protein
MATYDRSLESQDQPQKGPIDHSHVYYGPDSFATKQPVRDQPPKEGFWSRLRAAWRGKPPTAP